MTTNIDVLTLPQAVTDLKTTVTGLASDVTTQATGLVNGIAQDVTNQVNGAVTNLTNSASGLIGGVTDKIAALQNLATSDPASIAAKLGIDTSALSGLSSNLVSQLNSQLSKVTELIPTNVDIGAFAKQGLLLENLTKTEIANIPALQPIVSAPAALKDFSYESLIKEAKGSVDSLLSKATNLAPLTAINDIKNSIGGLAAGVASGVGNVQGLIGQVANVQQLTNDVIGSAVGVVNTVGSAAQNAIEGILPANVGLGSIESNLSTINNLTQNLPGSPNLETSVTSLFGSRQASSLVNVASTNNINNNGWGEG